VAGFLASFADFARFGTSIGEIKESAARTSELVRGDKFYSGNLDAFEMLIYGVRYVEDFGTEKGKQLEAVAMFWVPRDIWKNKAVPTGQLLGASYINVLKKTENTNLSAPIVLEGYINFGVVGVVLFATFMGSVAGVLDRAVLERRLEIDRTGVSVVLLVDALAGPLLGLWMFLCRGSLLAAVGYAFGIVGSSVFVWLLFFKARSRSQTNGIRNVKWIR